MSQSYHVEFFVIDHNWECHYVHTDAQSAFLTGPYEHRDHSPQLAMLSRIIHDTIMMYIGVVQ